MVPRYAVGKVRYYQVRYSQGWYACVRTRSPAWGHV